MEIESKVGIITGTKRTPFLLYANQYGLVPIEQNILYLNTSLKKGYDSTYKKFDFGYGLEPHLNAGKNTEVLLAEAYLKGRWKSIELYVGRKREIVGLVDTLGTIGSFIWSGNALPVPKFDIGIREFVPLFGSKLVSIKGNLAYGWLGSGDSVKNVLLHQKSLYLKLGKSEWKVNLIAGMNHQAQWGGRPSKPYVDRISGQNIDSYGHSFSDFLKVFTGRSIGAATGLEWDEVTGIPANEAGNRIGNHLGSIDVGINIHFDEFKLFVYRQSFYEDGSLFYLNNISDGLTGISLANGKFFKICVEYLKTTNQGGSIYYGIIPELRGKDNYFNNGIYKDAWTYRGKTIGNPLLNPYHENSDIIKLSSNLISNQNYIYNNRVKGVNIKALYNHKLTQFTSQVLFSNSLGNYRLPLNNLKQISLLQKIEFPFKGLKVKTDLAVDLGEYYKNGLGINFGVCRAW